MSSAAAAIPGDHSFLWRRLHSISGIFPVGVFLIEHLYSNAFALRGEKSYNDQVRALTGLPLLLAVETTFIFVPILYHSLYGIYIWWRGQSNLSQYPWVGNWLYTLQRYTGLVAFAYILFHTWEQRFTGAHLISDPTQAYRKVANSLSHPAIAAFYVVGMVAACFHFAYGLWLFGCKWGVTPGPRAQRASAVACGAIGFALLSTGLLTLGKFVFVP